MNTLQTIALSLVLLVSPMALASEATTTKPDQQRQSLEQLTEKLSRLEHFEGDFEQRQLDEHDTLLSAQHGHFEIMTPGKIRWESIEPMPQLLISDGEQYWLFDTDLEQVTVSAIGDAIQQTPAILFSGDTQTLSEHYRVSQKANGTFILNPIDEESLFTEISIGFSESNLQKMVMRDQLGQRTEFLFSNVTQITNLDASRFTFVVPEGVDVIYQ